VISCMIAGWRFSCKVGVGNAAGRLAMQLYHCRAEGRGQRAEGRGQRLAIQLYHGRLEIQSYHCRLAMQLEGWRAEVGNSVVSLQVGNAARRLEGKGWQFSSKVEGRVANSVGKFEGWKVGRLEG
jgi:hypothetical protein